MFEEKGSLEEVPAIRIVLSIFEDELTGILYLKNAETLKVLYMNRGKLVWTMSNSPKDKIEDILIAKGHSDAETISSVRTEGTVSSSIGKLLVEKGHLKLEQLVEATKIQAGRIVKSVIAWDHGGYQFVKEPPPERVFNLDINLMNFIFNFVLKELDMTLVWREIRTVRIHMEKTADREKLQKYNLTERELNFLENFSEGTSIESVLSRYAGSHRDTLLRFVYFFLSSGLLEKLDIEDDVAEGAPVDEAPAESISNLDGIFVDEQSSEAGLDANDRDHDVGIISKKDIPAPRNDGVEIEHPVDQEPIGEGPAVETPEQGLGDDLVLDEGYETTHEEIDDIGNISLDELERIAPEKEPSGIDLIAQTPERLDSAEVSIGDGVSGGEESGQYVFQDPTMADIEGPEDFEEDGLVAPPPVVPDKKKLKQFHYLILLVILILIIGGVIFLLLPEEELDLNGAATTPSNTNDNEKVINVTERKPVVRPKKRAVKKDEPAKTENKKVLPKKTTEISRKDTGKRQPVVDILRVFRQGDYRKAGELWRTGVVGQGVKYAILLELDCQKQSVANAFKECKNSKSFYILNIRRGDKNCFLVLWGRYFSEAEANAALGLIPGYFVRQTPPARVIELQKYL